MSAAVAALKSLVYGAPRRISELDATTEISRIAAATDDVAPVVEAIGVISLKVGGVRRLQIEYVDGEKQTAAAPLVWGAGCEEGTVGSAVTKIVAGGESWGELRLYFELQPSVLESPLRFAKFLAQQIALQASRRSLAVSAEALRERIEKLRKIIEKRKAIQRARAILANRRRIDDAAALAVMRHYSRESGRTLHEVAEAMIFGDASKWTSGSRYVEGKRALRLLAGSDY